MQQIFKLLKESPALYFATVDQSGLPKVRPVSLLLEKMGRMYFCTSSETSLFDNLSRTPYAEISVMSPEYVWLRISAKIAFSDDRAIKTEAIEYNQQIRKLFGSADNPDFNVFYLAEGTITRYDYSGHPPRVWPFKEAV